MNRATIVCGSPASGKSTYGKQLAVRNRAALLDLDTATERLVKLALSQSGQHEDDRDSQHYKAVYRLPAYEALYDIARENLASVDVVIVGPFTRELRDPDWPLFLEERLGARVEVHYLFCSPQIRRARMELRDNPRDAAKLANWDQQQPYYGAEDPPVFEHVFVDTSEKLNSACAGDGIAYSVDPGVSAEEFSDLLERSTLAERRPVNNPGCIRGMIENSNLVVVARQGDRLVGIARSLTDFHYACYLSDLAVDVECQGRGIGRGLLLETRKQLGPDCALTLLAAPAAEQFYNHIGFTRHPSAWQLKS